VVPSRSQNTAVLLGFLLLSVNGRGSFTSLPKNANKMLQPFFGRAEKRALPV
jgi:hypothetical protein